jgi:uncharacterized protein YbaR (Trm112 family)
VTVVPWVRAMLVCPQCRGDLEDLPDALRCRACRLRYPVVDGAPWLVPELATREDENQR